MMEGKWIGKYTYGEGYTDNSKGKSISFELDLTSNGVEFNGIFTDEETKNIFNEPGMVENGFLENTTISFTKKYPCLWGENETGEIEVYEDLQSHVIYYSGNLINGSFEGHWEILRFLVDENGPYTETDGSGTWMMNKIDRS